jgi:plasmid stabilization system protein ParE
LGRHKDGSKAPGRTAQKTEIEEMTRIIKRPAAKQDLIEQADYIAQDNLDAALRFLDAAEKTFAQLARLPRIGKSGKVKSRVFANVRQFPITASKST